MKFSAFAILSAIALSSAAAKDTVRTDPWLTMPGAAGKSGSGKKIVLISGDEEYRSEEALPQLGKILSQHHGFDCTVLFAINPSNNTVNPHVLNNIPGLSALEDADMMVLFVRFRQLPDEQMKHIIDFTNSGKPILGLRTSTHAFKYSKKSKSPYAKWSFKSKDPAGGYGQAVLGDTWVSHHGHHKKESARGIPNETLGDHPILRGIDDMWGPADVYGVKHLPEDAVHVIYGQVLETMEPDSSPLEGKKNAPMMPVIWTHEYEGETGNTSTVVTNTFFSSIDMVNEDVRRATVNSIFWALDMGDKVTPDLDVSIIGKYEPTMFIVLGRKYWNEKKLKVADFAPTP